MAKKTTLTRDAAAELEELMADATNPNRRFGDPKRDIKDLLRAAGASKDLIESILLRLNNIAWDVTYLEQEVSRGNAEVVVDGFKRLDEFLSKHFNVQMPRKNQKYRWMVG